MPRYFFTLLIALSMGVVQSATAGVGYSFTCQGENGEYRGRIDLGGGRAFDQITGFCVATGRFVHLSWRRGEPAPPPMQVWNPRTGERLALYQVSDCPDPIVPIERIEELQRLPACGRGGFEYKADVMFD